MCALHGVERVGDRRGRALTLGFRDDAAGSVEVVGAWEAWLLLLPLPCSFPAVLKRSREMDLAALGRKK